MPSKRDYLLVGVTGGIGSGKSLVCSLFERLGRPVLRADIIAQEISDADPVVRRRVAELLGPPAYPGGGTMDRKFVASRVFANHALLKKLNAIVHPPVIDVITRAAEGLPAAQRHPYVIVEAALIYESGMDDLLDRVIVVDAEEETRIRRVMERDGITRDAVLLRIAAQLPAAKKVARADFVIRNDSDAAAMDGKVRFLDTILKAMAPGLQLK